LTSVVDTVTVVTDKSLYTSDEAWVVGVDGDQERTPDEGCNVRSNDARDR